MRKLLLALSVIALGLSSISAQAANPTTASKPAMETTMAGTPSSKAQIASVRAAYTKALKNKAYTTAILGKDTPAVQKMLVAAGAPADVVVKINDSRTGTNSPAAKPRITITVTCCPLTITIGIK